MSDSVMFDKIDEQRYKCKVCQKVMNRLLIKAHESIHNKTVEIQRPSPTGSVSEKIVLNNESALETGKVSEILKVSTEKTRETVKSSEKKEKISRESNGGSVAEVLDLGTGFSGAGNPQTVLYKAVKKSSLQINGIEETKKDNSGLSKTQHLLEIAEKSKESLMSLSEDRGKIENCLSSIFKTPENDKKKPAQKLISIDEEKISKASKISEEDIIGSVAKEDFKKNSELEKTVSKKLIFADFQAKNKSELGKKASKPIIIEQPAQVYNDICLPVKRIREHDSAPPKISVLLALNHSRIVQTKISKIHRIYLHCIYLLSLKSFRKWRKHSL